MIALPETVILPLKMDENGAIRVSGTRVTLDTLIHFHPVINWLTIQYIKQ